MTDSISKNETPNLSECLERQNGYIQSLTEIMKIRAMGEKPMAYTHTYGCQGNVADGEKINGMLEQMGFGFTDDVNKADLILYNTCAVREHAEDRVFGNVGALKNVKRKNPSVIIVLCGCMMQQEHVAQRIKKSFPFVNLVFGTHVIHKFPELLLRSITDGKRVFDLSEEDEGIVEGIHVKRDGSAKAWVPIMYGCNNFCTYCIVPYVRGRERSREPEIILDEIRDLVKSGYKDITLLGQNVNSYGKNLENPISFSQLLRQINDIEGDFLIRFMTSHPKDCTHELIDTMAQCDKVAKHLHLPFQSGSDRILTAMNRHYTAEKYLSLINYAKEKMPDLSITSDIIVGFPGEEYEDFQKTMELVENVGFSSLFTFIFSPRKGTPAEKMEDKIPHEEKVKWFAELLKLQERKSGEYTSRFEGKTVRVLVEGAGKEAALTGRTQGNIIVEFDGDDKLIGNFVDVEITQAKTWILLGKTV